MDRSQVAVATIAKVRSDQEEQLLQRSLEQLVRLGLPVAIADAGTQPGFTAFLRSMQGAQVVRPAEAGLVGQVRASVQLAAATGARFVLYTAPDKQSFFAGPLDDFIRHVDGDGVGVALAARTADSFATFPPMQRYTENVVNTLCEHLIGQRGDYSYGPFLMNRALVPVVSALDPDLGWGWRHRVFLSARRGALRVLHVPGDYPCPFDQRNEDEAERTHRLRQLCQNVAGLIPEDERAS